MQVSRGFVWHELRTSDPEAGAKFYAELFGWKAVAREDGFELQLDSVPVAGVSQVKPGVPPHWAPFLEVADVDKAAAEWDGLGGQVFTEPIECPYPEGRLAVGGHAAAGGLVLFHGTDGNIPADAGRTAGQFGWHQLDTPQPEGAESFFREFAGWKAAGTAVDDVSVLRDPDREELATMTAAPSAVPAHWVSFVAVENLGDVLHRATELGALVVVEQTLMPPVGPTCLLRDHDGINIACFEP